jgi:DNA-binding transcriptional regulator YiaG
MSIPTGNETAHPTNPSRPGPVHDRAMHYIVEGALDAFCDWLNIKVEGQAEALSSVFAAEKRTADLLLRVGKRRLLHVEYIRNPKADLFARMVGYRAHIMRRYQGMSLHQVAIVLGKGRLRTWDDPETGFFLGLDTVYLNEEDPQEFLTRPGLAALAELAKGDLTTRAKSAIAALKAIQTLPEERHQGLREAMLALATITLAPSTIDLIRKETGMSIQSLAAFYRQTDVGQEILEQGSAKTLAAMIRRRFGDDDRIATIAGLLAQISEDASVRIVDEATSLNDLLSRVPQARTASI